MLLSDDHFTGVASFRGDGGLGAFATTSRTPTGSARPDWGSRSVSATASS